jgi:hypothetical protein
MNSLACLQCGTYFDSIDPDVFTNEWVYIKTRNGVLCGTCKTQDTSEQQKIPDVLNRIEQPFSLFSDRASTDTQYKETEIAVSQQLINHLIKGNDDEVSESLQTVTNSMLEHLRVYLKDEQRHQCALLAKKYLKQGIRPESVKALIMCFAETIYLNDPLAMFWLKEAPALPDDVDTGILLRLEPEFANTQMKLDQWKIEQIRKNVSIQNMETQLRNGKD